jgi:ketosteroid isomerase-like protein
VIWKLLAFTGLMFSFASTPAWAAPPATALTSVRHAIDAGNAKFLKALESGDGKSYAALFAPDGVELLSGGGGATTGRSAIAADEIASAKAARVTGGSIHTTNVYLDGSTAYETGIYSFDVVLPGKPAKVVTGRYFEIWQQQPGGAWLIKVDCGYPDKYVR